MSKFLEYLQKIDSQEQFQELPKISVVGCFQNGKSTFINCILEQLVARSGENGGGIVTTKISTRYRWGETTSVQFRTNQGKLISIPLVTYLEFSNLFQIHKDRAFQVEITLAKPILKTIELIDTPGFNANEQDTENVTRSLEEANYAIVVLTNQRTLGEPELAMFECIKSKSIPYVIFMNCINNNTITEWIPNAPKNLKIIQENEAILAKYGYLPDKINQHIVYPCNLLWYWFAISRNKYYSLSFCNNEEYEEDLADKIEWALRKQKETLSTENLIRLSNFAPIKFFFENYLALIT